MAELFSVVVAAANPETRQLAASAIAQQDSVWCVIHVGDLSDLVHWTAAIHPDFVFLADDLGAGPLTLAWLCDRSPDTCFLGLSGEGDPPTLERRSKARAPRASLTTASAA